MIVEDVFLNSLRIWIGVSARAMELMILIGCCHNCSVLQCCDDLPRIIFRGPFFLRYGITIFMDVTLGDYLAIVIVFVAGASKKRYSAAE
jgi:hypothetical protein